MQNSSAVQGFAPGGRMPRMFDHVEDRPRRFDDQVAGMQGPQAERNMADAFAMTPAEPGAAARQAALAQ